MKSDQNQEATPENNRYTLRFPFRLAPGQEFSNLDQPYEVDCFGLSLSLGSKGGLYFFSVAGFPEEDAGKAFIPKLWAELMWALLHQGVSPNAEFSPQNIKYIDNPTEVAENVSRSLGLKFEKLDGILDGSRPAVYDSLIREVGFRKEKSIRSSIRNLVYLTLHPSDPETEALSRQAVTHSDMRSRLVLDGHVPGEDLGQAVTSIREIVFRVLKALFLKVASRER